MTGTVRVIAGRRRAIAAVAAVIVSGWLVVAAVVVFAAGATPPPAVAASGVAVPAGANDLPPPLQPAGVIVDVQGIRVDASLASNLGGLLAAAREGGLNLSGAGHRTRDDQIMLRRAHCGSSDYAVFEMSADGCSPPTARPGESLHESGLAIDFTCGGELVSRLDVCFAFLTGHAAAYGLFNLPTEPWHWSMTGR